MLVVSEFFPACALLHTVHTVCVGVQEIVRPARMHEWGGGQVTMAVGNDAKGFAIYNKL